MFDVSWMDYEGAVECSRMLNYHSALRCALVSWLCCGLRQASIQLSQLSGHQSRMTLLTECDKIGRTTIPLALTC